MRDEIEQLKQKVSDLKIENEGLKIQAKVAEHFDQTELNTKKWIEESCKNIGTTEQVNFIKNAYMGYVSC